MVGAQQNCGVILQFSTSALNLAELWKYRNTSDLWGDFLGCGQCFFTIFTVKICGKQG